MSRGGAVEDIVFTFDVRAIQGRQAARTRRVDAREGTGHGRDSAWPIPIRAPAAKWALPVTRELEQLTATGLVHRTVQGRQVYFRVNREAPVLPELQSLFAKTAGLADVLREALAALGGQVRVAFVFGFAAHAELRASRMRPFSK